MRKSHLVVDWSFFNAVKPGDDPQWPPETLEQLYRWREQDGAPWQHFWSTLLAYGFDFSRAHFHDRLAPPLLEDLAFSDAQPRDLVVFDREVRVAKYDVFAQWAIASKSVVTVVLPPYGCRRWAPDHCPSRITSPSWDGSRSWKYSSKLHSVYVEPWAGDYPWGPRTTTYIDGFFVVHRADTCPPWRDARYREFLNGARWLVQEQKTHRRLKVPDLDDAGLRNRLDAATLEEMDRRSEEREAYAQSPGGDD